MYLIRWIKRLIKSRSKGFLLAEAIFSVFVTLLVVLMLQNLMKTILVANRANHKTDDIAFAYMQFNRFFKGKETKTSYVLPTLSSSKQVGVVKIDGNGAQKTYIVTYYKHMIRVTTRQGGHMPLLLNVRNASFATKNRQIKIDVTESDGRKSEMFFKLDAKPKKKGKNDQKKQTENAS